jgi:tetratricopeptide (TPR) repeat protein
MQFKIRIIVSIIILLFLSCPAFSKNIAVMPFDNITKDKDKNWIGAGFAETLTTKLCKVKEISMLEREQLSKILDEIKFQLSGMVDENTAVKIGKMYGVDVMVLGSYQVMENTLRVSARFVDVETRKVIDTSEATGNLNDIFKLQDEIAFSLMNSLEIALAEKEKQEIKINPTNSLTVYQWSSKGDDAYNFKLYDKAIEYYKEAIKIDPMYVNAYYNIGIAYGQKGDYDEALQMFKKAVIISPNDETLYYGVGAAYSKKESHDKAIKMYKKALDINPEYVEAYYNMGLEYVDKGEYDKAIEMFEKTVSLNPENYKPYLDIGSVYFLQGSFKKAIESYRKAINVNPEYAEAYYGMGLAYNRKGNYGKAIKMYEKAISINSSYAAVYYEMCRAYGNKGDNSMSFNCLMKAAKLGEPRAREILTKQGIKW